MLTPDFLTNIVALVIILVAVGFLVLIFSRRQMDQHRRSSEEELLALKSRGDKVYLRFNYLFNNTTDSVYCYEFHPPMSVELPLDEQIERSRDAILKRCNPAFSRELGTTSVDDIVGTRFGMLDSSKNAPVHVEYFTAFIENGYSLTDYELNYSNEAGKNTAVKTNMVGVVRDGLLECVWVVESNVLALRQTQAELEHRQDFQALVAAVSSRLVRALDGEADDVVESCLETVCQFIDADRAAIFWRSEDSESFTASHMWSQDGNPFVASLALSAFPEISRQLRGMQTIRADSLDSLSAEYDLDKKNLAAFDTKAFVILPLIVESEAVGGMSIGRLREPRAWSDQDMQDLTVLSKIFGSFIGRMMSRRALTSALSGLRQATDRLEAENTYLREEIEITHGFDEIVGQSKELLHTLKLVEQVADTRTSVLLLGETGTGKELVARAIHDLSDRRERSLVKVNCAALPANLIESELFGHEKGAFTGADRAKRGRFDLAAGSTLFLDEITEIPVELQAKLLRVLQEGEFERLGGTKTITADVRIVAATNRDIQAAVRSGEFRSDLFYRINTFPIELPALRDRGDDVQLLARHFVKIHALRLNRDVREISSEMMRQVRAYHWPGNVRELEGIIQRALISSSGPILDLAEPLVWTNLDDGSPRIISSSIAELKLVERDHIVSVLEGARWKISGTGGAAARLGVPPSTLRSKMKKLGIERPY